MHTIDQLTAFVAVYDSGSYSAAAKVTKKSRATIREHILSYEDTLGYELFGIEGKKAAPTANAKRLIKRARLLVSQHQSMFSHGLSLFDKPIAEINISFDTITPTKLIADTDSYIRANWPHLNINWIHRNREQSLNGLIVGEFDIAILPAQIRALETKSVTWKSLGYVSMGIFTSKSSPLAAEQDLTMEDLLNETHLLCEAQYDLDMNLSSFKVTPNANLISNNDVLCELLKLTGWAFMPRSYVNHLVENKELVELNIKEVNKHLSFGLNAFHTYGKEQEEPFTSIINFMKKWF